MIKERIALLGATGSIGKSTVAVLRRYPERFSLEAIAAQKNVDGLVALAKRFAPRFVAIADATHYQRLVEKLALAHVQARVLAGPQAIVRLASHEEIDTVVQAVVGAAGVAPTFAAVRSGKRLLLANKESVVCGGGYLMGEVKRFGATLLPVDSEHSAIFQCLQGVTENDRKTLRLLLTASGGPFRGRKDLRGVTPAQAVAHPNWSMGAKISVDSASLMNKGLEVIEASWLFDVPHDRIDVVVHPESIIHSMVTLADGAVLAQLGVPTMKEPISYALGYPERLPAGVPHLNLATLGRLTFEEPDTKTFPLLEAAYESLRMGGASSIVLNAANERAVAAFLAGKIDFLGLFAIVQKALGTMHYPRVTSVERILAIDKRVRARVRAMITQSL